MRVAFVSSGSLCWEAPDLQSLAVVCGGRRSWCAGEVPRELLELAALETLRLSDNQLSGELLRDAIGIAACMRVTVVCQGDDGA